MRLSLKVVKISKEADRVKASINVEGARSLIYVFFYVVVGTGMTLTSLYESVDFDDNIVLTYFGTNNICVNFDYPPSTYVLPSLWAVCNFVYVVERTAALTRLWLCCEHRHIASWEFQLIRFLIVYQIFSGWFFSTIFAVQPHDLHTLRIHTIPFTNLIVSLSVMAMTNAWYGWRVGYDNFELPRWQRWMQLCWAVSLLFVSTQQVIHQAYVLVYGYPWNDAPFPLNLSLGVVWLLLAIVYPPLWNLYLNCVLSEKAVNISMDLDLALGSGKEVHGAPAEAPSPREGQASDVTL